MVKSQHGHRMYVELYDISTAGLAMAEVFKAFRELGKLDKDDSPVSKESIVELCETIKLFSRILDEHEDKEDNDRIEIYLTLDQLRAIGSSSWVALKWGTMPDDVRDRLKQWTERVEYAYDNSFKNADETASRLLH